MFRTAALALAAVTFAKAMPALAAPGVLLASDVFVEHSGDSGRVVERAGRLHPGDRVVTVLTWRRTGGGQFTLTNPLPRALQFEDSASDAQEVSVDGGRSWGRLGSLRVGNRVASPEDVTHIRWRILTPAPEGRIAYSAIVR